MSRAIPDLEAEQEVDFGRYWRALVMRWWLPLAGIVAGAVIGALVSIGGSSSWTATAQVYLGQAFAPGTPAALASARALQQQVLKDKAISSTDKLVALANQNSVITQALAQQNGLSLDRFTVSQLLSLAQDIEVGRIVSSATATKSAGPRRRTALLIGAFIGLVIGIFAALLWEPLGIRTRTEP